MEPAAAKPGPMRSILTRLFLFALLALLLRFTYVVSLSGYSCTSGDFCFFSAPDPLLHGTAPAASAAIGGASPALWSTRDWRKNVEFYSAVFQDLIVDGYLSTSSKSLCINTPAGYEVLALHEIGVSDAIGLHRKKSPPLVVAGDLLHQPFDNDTFDFIFAGRSLDDSTQPVNLAAEISRILKTEGYLTVLTGSAGDLYSLHSLLELFPYFRKVQSRDINSLREIVLQKEEDSNILGPKGSFPGGNSVDKCPIPEHKTQLLRSAEPLISEEPMKPWITLKKNIKNIKYLPAVADISFKQRYVYVDVGARSYTSSIGSWFRKQYPKQNRTFDIYAIEADKLFHHEYSTKKGITLLPYAAWVRNESLSFEVNHDHDAKSDETGGRGMGRIRQAGASDSGDSHTIQGFDFAEWLKSTVTERDYVVMKMDVEGTEFDLVPRLFETGAICLIDELFLECHYNRWQRCCPGVRSPKYQYTYGECLDLFSSLRDSGVLVHQWW